ncbi:MAG: hypothetical protein MUF69_07195 [Desulfobacterota bacterium]|nr:hypothetical protein [Thermodesulfobacteriota bacterium]
MKKMVMLLWTFGLTLTLGAPLTQAEQKQPVKEISPPSFQREQKAPPRFPDAGGEGVVRSEVDLVVSKVQITRGVFAGENKIQIIPYIKNMWTGRTSARIKVYFREFETAIWMEGGIGPGEEKSAGAIYRSYDPAHPATRNFSVEVDNSNAIPETNDLNNRCDGLFYNTAEASRTHTCVIRGPHEPLR